MGTRGIRIIGLKMKTLSVYRASLCALILLLAVSCKQETYYNITTHIQPEGSGAIVVSPSSGSVLEGTSVSFTAKPNGDYLFTGWGGSLSGTENPKTVTVLADMVVTANFELKTYPLTVSVEGDGSVSERVVSTKADYGSGTVVELTAQPTDHWLFDHWEGDLSGNTNPAKITVASAKSVKAVFVKKMYDLTVTIEGEGAVSETVVDTRSGSYQEGTVVQLTATPSTGWSFNHWEGDLSGTDNPAQITISGAKSIKAIFKKNKYAYNLKIVGPGVVDEYLVPDTKATLDYGTQALLKAFPTEGAVFKGWSGDIESTDPEISVAIKSDINLVATFASLINKYQIPNLSYPSKSFQRLYMGERLYQLQFFYHTNQLSSLHILSVDYNMDGILDAIVNTANNQDYSHLYRLPVGFFLGQSDGTFVRDPVNDSHIEGLIGPGKFFYGDYNNDGRPDICLLGAGYDSEPFPGEYPIILMSGSGGKYSDIRFTDHIGYYGSGSSGDIDNDGDTDIVISSAGIGDSIIMINDGTGHFTVSSSLIDQDLMQSMYTVDLWDVDKDGILDLVCGGHDGGGSGPHFEESGVYGNAPIIIWGNKKDFNGSYTRLPNSGITGFGVVRDFAFHDIDGDNADEIFITRTGDGVCPEIIDIYGGNYIQVISNKNGEYRDITNTVFNEGDNYQLSGKWNAWLDFERTNEKLYLLTTAYDCLDPLRQYELVSGHFIKVQDNRSRILSSGLPIYDNGAFFSDNVLVYQGEDIIDVCDNTLSETGGRCLHWTTSKPWSGGIECQFSPSLNLSSLMSYNNYCLEYRIKCNNKDSVFGCHINSSNGMYGYGYTGFSGDWETIQIPLSNFYSLSDPDWLSIYCISFWVDTSAETEFLIDGIRIRRIVDIE